MNTDTKTRIRVENRKKASRKEVKKRAPYMRQNEIEQKKSNVAQCAPLL